MERVPRYDDTGTTSLTPAFFNIGIMVISMDVGMPFSASTKDRVDTYDGR